MYPRGDNVYALANPHNFQSMFKPGQLLRAIVLDSAALLMSIKQGLATDLITQAHLRHLRSHQLHPDPMDDPWTLSKDGEFLLFKGALFSLTMPMSIWMSYSPTTTTTSQDIWASARQLITSDTSSTSPNSSDSSPTLCGPAQPVTEANQSTTSLLVLFNSFQLPYNLGIQFPWTS